MHKDELDEAERVSFERAMETVRGLPAAEQHALLEHAVATSIRYATTQKDQVLTEWALSLLTTVRMAASTAFKAATAHHQPPDLRQPGMSAKELLAGLRR
jgi:hypothetical protein